MPRTTRRPWGLIAFTGLLAVGMLGAVSWLALHTDPREARALRTFGATIAVTRGDEPLVLGANWQKAVLRVFPQAQRFTGGGRYLPPATILPNSLVVWKTMGINDLFDFLPRLQATLTDERGNVMEEWSSSNHLSRHENKDIAPFAFGNYPRRGKQIRIHSEGGKAAIPPLPDLTVPNPTPETFPEWDPEPIPATRRDGDLMVMLDRFTTANLDDSSEDTSRRSELELRIFEKGRPAAKDWEVESVAIDDPTGNHWQIQPTSTSSSTGSDRVAVVLGERVFPVERAYRVRVELARRTNLASEDLCTFSSLRLPPQGQTARIGHKRKVHGSTLELIQLAGPGADAGYGFVSSDGTAWVRVTGDMSRYRLGRIVDPDGMRWKPSYPASRWGLFGFHLHGCPKERPFALRLALTPRRTFEFLVPITISR